MATNAPSLAGLFSQADLKKGLSSIPLGTLTGLTSGAIGDLVAIVGDLTEVPLDNVLISAWTAYRELKKYADPRQYPPDTIARLTLSTHRLTSTHEPRIDIRVPGLPPVSLNFELKLELTVEGAILVIHAGRVTGLDGARGQVRGTLKCQGRQIAQAKSKPYSFAEKALTFPTGIPIDSSVQVSPLAQT